MKKHLNPRAIKDKYFYDRGGYCQFLLLSCELCGRNLCTYQKDGPGKLKRLYIDRVGITFGLTFCEDDGEECAYCQLCNSKIGTVINYKKESRQAIHLYESMVVAKNITITSR